MLLRLTRQPPMLLLLAIALWFLCNQSVPAPHPSPGFSRAALRYLASGWNSWFSHAYWLTLIEPPRQANESPPLRAFTRVLTHTPSNRFFRIQAAGMLAFDLPPTASNRRCAAVQGTSVSAALRVLSQGIDLNPADAPYYYYEIGKIQLLKHNDREGALHSFRKAAQPKEPEFSPPTPPAP